jgi:predicted kinase
MTVILVAGPPCGGKTTYVRNHAKAEDVQIDFDSLVEEEGTGRYDQAPDVLRRARQRWRDALDAVTPEQTAWVIWSAPRRMDRGRFRAQYGAEVVVVMAPEALCMERAKAERPPIWQRYVRSWFREWAPSSTGRERLVSGYNNSEAGGYSRTVAPPQSSQLLHGA